MGEIIVCSNCGRQLPEKIRFCPHCATPQTFPTLCPQCGREIPRDAQRCPFCDDHQVPTQITQPALRRDDTSIATPIPPDDYDCPHCGFRVSFQMSQCPICDQALTVCGICHRAIVMEQLIARCPACAGLFHVDHLREWLKIHGSCPTCQHDLPESAIESWALKNSF
ncbi:MAG: zinc ribbon domain-containing protein [Candidatus Heimdallarchaeota archaeon]